MWDNYVGLNHKLQKMLNQSIIFSLNNTSFNLSLRNYFQHLLHQIPLFECPFSFSYFHMQKTYIHIFIGVCVCVLGGGVIFQLPYIYQNMTNTFTNVVNFQILSEIRRVQRSKTSESLFMKYWWWNYCILALRWTEHNKLIRWIKK